MGSLLSCFSSSKNKTSSIDDANKPQTFSASQDAQQGLRDEHLASVPPPTVEATAIASGEATRRAAVEAPVPVPVPTA